MFADIPQWTEYDGVYCTDKEEHSTTVETVTVCQGLCLERDNCVGVSFSYWSDCYFCRSANTRTDAHWETYLLPGNPELIVFSNMLGMFAAANISWMIWL